MAPKRKSAAISTTSADETPKAKRPAAAGKAALSAGQAASAAAKAETPPKQQQTRAQAKAKGKAKAKAVKDPVSGEGEVSAKSQPKPKAKAVKDAAASEGEVSAKSQPKRQSTAQLIAEKSLSKNSPLKRSPTPRWLCGEGEGEAKILKVLSVNVAGLRPLLAKDSTKKALREVMIKEAPDVLCINETKLQESHVEDAEEQLREVLLPEGADSSDLIIHWTCSTAKKGYSGVAMCLIRRSAPEGLGAIADPAAVPVYRGMEAGAASLAKAAKEDPIVSEEGRLLTAEFPDVTIVAVYVPNSGKDLERLDYRVNKKRKQCWDRDFANYVKSIREKRGKPVIVIGDLNCAHRVHDIWNMYERPDFPDGLAEKPIADQYVGLTGLKKQAGLTPEERESLTDFMKDADLIDTFRAIHPKVSGVFSWFSVRSLQNRPLNRGLRLDYVLASTELAKHLEPRSSAPDDITAAASIDVGEKQRLKGEERSLSVEMSELPLPRVLDSFILDEGAMFSDHTPVGCSILLPHTQ